MSIKLDQQPKRGVEKQPSLNDFLLQGRGLTHYSSILSVAQHNMNSDQADLNNLLDENHFFAYNIKRTKLLPTKDTIFQQLFQKSSGVELESEDDEQMLL